MKYYILVDPDRPTKCKLGVTRDETKRIRAYRTSSPQCYFLKVYKDIDIKHEKRILDIMRELFIVDREYVHCHPDIVVRIVDEYFREIELGPIAQW